MDFVDKEERVNSGLFEWRRFHLSDTLVFVSGRRKRTNMEGSSERIGTQKGNEKSIGLGCWWNKSDQVIRGPPGRSFFSRGWGARHSAQYPADSRRIRGLHVINQIDSTAPPTSGLDSSTNASDGASPIGSVVPLRFHHHLLRPPNPSISSSFSSSFSF